MIKMIDLAAEYQRLKDELDPAIQQILEKGNYIQGEEVKIFEKQLAAYLNIKHVISCANGTDALQIALMALGINVDDEIIIPAFSYVSVIEVICLLGAKPVLVDVNPDTFQIDENEIKEAITSKTKAIIPVHLFGACGNLADILNIAKENQLFVIEDNAQALGAKYQNQFLGTWGDIGCTSFFPTKNLACFGDGGALFTNDDELAERIRSFRNYGSAEKYVFNYQGYNSRMDEIQAAILSLKLPNLDIENEYRRRIAERYLREINNPKIILPPSDSIDNDVWHLFVIRTKRRDELQNYLAENGVQTLIHYPIPPNKQWAYKEMNHLDFPITNTIQNEVLSLPISPVTTEKEVTQIIQILNSYAV